MAGFAALALDSVYMSSLGAFMDTFVLVRRQVETLLNATQPIRVDTPVALLTPDGRPVRMADGRRLEVDAGIHDNGEVFALVHLPAFVVGSEQLLDARLAEADMLCSWLRYQHTEGALISASGPAAFLLAQAGLLEEGVAAVARPLIPFFRRRYPRVRVDEHQTVVEHDRVVTGIGLAADAQLLARVIERATAPELAQWLRDVTGANHAAEDEFAEDPLVAKAQLWLEERFTREVSIAELARAMGVSQQTLLRHFRRHLDLTPREYIRRRRIEGAQRLLLRTQRPIEQIASLVGYSDVHSFRKAFREYTGMSARRYRAMAKAVRP